MTLASGSRLGPYEIVDAIGAGGMGEVYKARDTRLNRTVAIKTLPASLHEDPDRRQRFLREAQAVAALEHPHICVLHDIGHQAGVDFLVMEYLDGETLASRLENGAMPMEQALRYAIEIAAALDKAHRQGIVHRDLKPGNIMLTKSGAKLLDFGLAKLRPSAVAPAGATMLTQAPPLTGEGSILGTLHHMAPEQLEGRDADARSDVFAFGTVLYEMLTGRPAFEGRSPASLVAAILEHDPAPMSTPRVLMPPLVDRIVRRCLAKHPDERWQSAADLTFALGCVGGEAPRTMASAELDESRRKARVAWSVAAGTGALAVILAAVALLAWTRSATAPAAQSPVRLLLSEQLPASTADPLRSFAISRDGARVVYVAEGEGRIRRLYLRDLRSTQAAPLAGTENAVHPFFSTDGQRIGFFGDGKLKVLALTGGAPIAVADAPNARGAVWAPDDTIIYSPTTDAGLWQVPAAGGPPHVLAQPDSAKGERGYRWPELLPEGDAVVFTLATSDILSFDDARLMARSLRTGEQHEVLRGGSFPTYAPTGHLLYVRGGALLAAPFDVKRQRVTGTSRPVLDGVVTYPTVNGAAQYALAKNGTLLYVAGGPTGRKAALSWIDKNGAVTPLPVEPAAYQGLSLSPDGRRVALDIDGANASIWILDLDRTATTRLTFDWSNNGPSWAAGGERIAFTSARAGVRTLYWQRADGQGGPEPVFPPGQFAAQVSRSSFSRDGRFVVFDGLSQQTGFDLWLVQLDAVPRTPKPLLQTAFNERQPALSPDGRWLAYSSDISGRPEIYVQPFPGPGGKWAVSTEGGTQPIWARDGRALFYAGNDAIMEVPITVSPSFSLSRPRSLFRKSVAAEPWRPTFAPVVFDVAADRRFLMIENQPSTAVRPVTVVLNWLQELQHW